MITPTLKPGVLSLGDLFTATWNTYRAKFRLFVTLAAVPALLLGALFLLYMGGISALRSFTGEFESVLPVLLAGGAVLLVGSFVGALYQYRCLAMMSLATRDLAAGHEPTWADLHERTRGFMSRMLLLLAAAFALMLIPIGLVFAWFVVVMMSDNLPSGSTLAMGIGVTVLLLLLVYAVALLVAVRLVYVLPVMGIEQQDGVGAVRRSWELTRGVFWVTVGYYLLMQLALSLPGSIASSLLQVALVPLEQSRSLDGLGPMQPVFLLLALVAGLVGVAALALLQPVGQIYVTAMYLSRLRELASEPPSTFLTRPAYPYGTPYGAPQPYARPFGAQPTGYGPQPPAAPYPQDAAAPTYPWRSQYPPAPPDPQAPQYPPPPFPPGSGPV